MHLRLLAVAFVALLFAVAQIVGTGASLFGNASAYAAFDGQRPASVVQQDDNEEDDEDDDSDNEDAEDDADNADEDDLADADNTDDEEDDSADDEDTEDDGDVAAAGPAPIEDESLKQPLQPASGTSTGSDALVATPGERVAIRMFPWMPAGVQVTIRPLDPNSVPAAPGARVGDLAFAIEARDASGMQLSTLPAEVNLAIRYADSTISGLNEQGLTLSRLNPTTNQWQSAPKLVREPDSNYVAASVTELGTYVVSAP